MSDLGVPAFRTEDVTPSDTTVLTGCRALYIGVAGDVAVMARGDTTPSTFVAHPAGYMFVQAKQVLATGTTATNIVALF